MGGKTEQCGTIKSGPLKVDENENTKAVITLQGRARRLGENQPDRGRELTTILTHFFPLKSTTLHFCGMTGSQRSGVT